ncbi:MAG: hypothetical protein IJW72_06080 [Alphaproteobacteria bacterium]|nr:hypothetical protein [Alphaproteobacteria bacterium]MBQ7285802.1 hypothetical protein [Alphaproteobacteria bacterium]
MMRTIFKLVGVLLLLSACASSHREADYMCPNVRIPRDTAYVTQQSSYSEEVQIEIVGYEGYCVTANTIDRRYAVIKPLFKIRRLKEGQDTRIDFSYYTKTIQGPPEFLGLRKYFASVDIPHDVAEKEFSGGEVKVRIPIQGYNDFAILLGMDVSAAEYDYNQKTFDIEYRYLTEEEIHQYNKTVTPKIIEVEKAPDVQYIPLKPLPTKQDSPKKSDCGCGL